MTRAPTSGLSLSPSDSVFSSSLFCLPLSSLFLGFTCPLVLLGEHAYTPVAFSAVLAAVILVGVAQQVTGSAGGGLAEALAEMTVGHLPGVAQLRRRADGIGAAQTGGHGRLEGKSFLRARCIQALELLVEGQVWLRDVALGR